MTFIGRYEIKGELGQGGMATVFLAYDPQMKRDVAIKVLPPHLLNDANFRGRFEREAQIIASLEHAAIVPVYDFGEYQGQPFLVMRLMTGGALANYLTEPLPLNKIQSILRQIASALDNAHDHGIIHRDLKPGNILFDHEGQVYLSDFGIAKLTETTNQFTATGGLIGTPAYMSPEQAMGNVTLDGRSDIYSLGIILFEMLTGRTPFNAPTPIALVVQQIHTPLPPLRAFNPNLPAGLEQVIALATTKDRNYRYATAGQLAQAFEQVLAGQWAAMPTVIEKLPLPSPTVTDSPPPPKINSTLQWVIGLFAVIGLIGFIALAGNLLLGGEPAATPTAVVLFITATFPPTTVTHTPLAPTITPTLTSPTPTSLPSPTATNSPTPSPTTVVVYSPLYTGRDRVIMRLVPAGEFLMGSTNDQLQTAVQLCQDSNSDDVCAFGEFANEMPQHPVYLDAFYIGETEITNDQYRACVNASYCSPPDNGSGRYPPNQYYNISSYANYPVVWVSWYDASDYCAWAGGRLPSEAEWEKAARGTDGRLFPWGDDFDPGKTNTEEGGGDILRPVGQYPAGASPYDLLDMAGSVWEWVEDWFDSNYYTISPDSNPFGPSVGQEKVLRGSSYSNHAHYARVSNRGLAPPSGPNGSSAFRGFRCVINANETNQ